MSAMTAERDPVSLRELIEGVGARELITTLEGRITYRQLDYWIRNGWVTVSGPADGSGSRRRLTEAEALAVADLVDEYERIKQLSARLTSGEYFVERLAHHRAAAGA